MWVLVACDIPLFTLDDLVGHSDSMTLWEDSREQSKPGRGQLLQKGSKG